MSWGNQARHKDTRRSRSVPRSIALASWSSGRTRPVKALKMSKPQPNRLGSAKVSSNTKLLQNKTKTAKMSILSLNKTLELMVFEKATNNRKLLKWYQYTRLRTKWCQMIMKGQFHRYQWKMTTINWGNKRKLTATITIAECRVSMRYNFRQSHLRALKSWNRLFFP